MVTAVPPVLLIVNVRLAVLPTETVPKSTASLENCSSPGRRRGRRQVDGLGLAVGGLEGDLVGVLPHRGRVE